MKTLVKQSFSDRVISLIEAARAKTVVAVNLAMVYTYYEVGRMIIEEEQGGKKRAGYGEKLLIDLARKLTAKFGKGYSAQNLRNMRQFFLLYSQQQICQTASGISKSKKICQTVSGKLLKVEDPPRRFVLSWSHYLKLMRIEDPNERAFYEIEAQSSTATTTTARCGCPVRIRPSAFSCAMTKATRWLNIRFRRTTGRSSPGSIGRCCRPRRS